MEHEIVTLARFVDDWLDMAVAVATPVDNYVQETFDIWNGSQVHSSGKLAYSLLDDEQANVVVDSVD
jgi:hypothetical protein